MHVLTLICGVLPSPRLRPLLQEIAAIPSPDVPGLRVRHWRQDRRFICGRYAFNSRESLEAFSRYPAADPAVARIAHEIPGSRFEVGQVKEIISNEILDRPIFIISAPRAGSTLLFELLSHSAQLWTLDGESHGVIDGIASLHLARRGFEGHQLTADDADPETVAALRVGFIAEIRNYLGRRYLDLPPRERPSCLRLLEKTPENVLRIPFLVAAFPDARFIFLHRDARQNISSLIEAWHHGGFINIPDLPGWERRHWCFLLPPGWRRLHSASLSDVAAFQWRAANEKALDDLTAVPREQWTVVEYADFVNAPEAVIRRLYDFMPIEIDTQLAATLVLQLSMARCHNLL